MPGNERGPGSGSPGRSLDDLVPPDRQPAYALGVSEFYVLDFEDRADIIGELGGVVGLLTAVIDGRTELCAGSMGSALKVLQKVVRRLS
jgi:hypothetical protein